VVSIPEPDRNAQLAYGAYLSGPAGHCLECHSPLTPKGPDLASNLGAGGFEFHGSWGVRISSNITLTGLADRSDDEIKAMITSGRRPDGSRMLPPMAYAYYTNIKHEDLDAIVAYLRTLPAK
jgi:mono/diheme cytochrome c family protein